MKCITAVAIVLACNGCALLGTPMGKAIARSAIDIARDVLVERLAGVDPSPESFCVGEWDERVCYVPDPAQAAAVIMRDFDERGAVPDTKNTQCFDAAEETGNDRVTGLICYAPECSTCDSTATEETNGSESGNGNGKRAETPSATQRKGASDRHREGDPEGSAGLHSGRGREDGQGDVRDGEGHGEAAFTGRGGVTEADRGARPVVQLWLARAAVGECDFILPDCHAATWFTLQRRWRRLMLRWPRYTLDQMARNYCAVFKGKPERRKRWVRGLSAAGTRPDGWPSGNVPWARQSVRWAAIYARAGAFLRGEVKDPCRGKPTHLGGLIDRGRMSPHKWQMVPCGRTGDQRFWEARS